MNSANFLSTNEDLRLNQYLTTKKKKKVTFYQTNSRLKIKNLEKTCVAWTMNMNYKI